MQLLVKVCSLIGVTFVFIASTLATEQAGSYTLNGEKLKPYAITPLRDLGWDDPRILVDVDQRITLLLDRSGEYHFIQPTNETDRVYQEVDGKLKLVGLMLAKQDDALEPDLIHDLHGVVMYGCLTQRQLDALVHIDPEKTFVRYGLPHEWKKTSYMPSLNPAIRFLHVDSSGCSPNDVDISTLSELINLEFLILEKDLGEPVDLALIKQCSQMKYLNLSMQHIEHVESLAQLQELRSLDLSWCDELTNIDFVSGYSQLRKLFISCTPVRDLMPIDGLQYIEYIDARSSEVGQLPVVGLPSLTTLKLMSSNVKDDMVEAFKALNPQCKISYSWNDSLKDALVDIDRIHIRSGGTCHRSPEEESTLLEITNTPEILEFLSLICIDPEESNFHCGCCGNPSFEFYRGGELVVTLGFHHGKSLRWPGGEWPADGALTADSRDKFIEWLDQKGVDGPRREIEESLRQKKEYELAWSRWVDAMPDSLKSFFEKDGYHEFSKEEIMAMHDALIKQLPDSEDRIRALLKWYGSGKGPWSPCYAYENVPEKILFKYDTTEILLAMEGAKLSDAQVEGAARFFGGWSFSVTRPDDRKLIPPKVKKMLLEHCLKSDNDDKKGRATSAFD